MSAEDSDDGLGAIARKILDLNFDVASRDRMQHLLAKKRAAELTQDEEIELDKYTQVGRLLDALKSRARK
jgi:hypothetical protein